MKNMYWVPLFLLFLLQGSHFLISQITPGDPGNFITIWDTQIEGSTDSMTVYFSILGDDYDIYWESLSDPTIQDTIFGVSDPVEVHFPFPGKYRLEVSGNYSAVRLRGSGDKKKITSVEQWGNNEWESLIFAFSGCSNLKINAEDSPDLSRVNNLASMFNGCEKIEFDPSMWDVGNIESFAYMFSGATSFNQDLSGWDFSSMNSVNGIFNNTSLDCENYGRFLEVLTEVSQLPDYRIFKANGLVYLPEHKEFRDKMIEEKNWSFEGDVLKDKCKINPGDSINFVTVWKTTNPGGSEANEVKIEVGEGTFNYDIYWESLEDSTFRDTLYGIRGDATIQFPMEGEVRIEILGGLPHLLIGPSQDRNKIISVLHWGSNRWESFSRFFAGCERLKIFADDVPDLSGVEAMGRAFSDAENVNMNVDNWDVSSIKNMLGLFENAKSFNQSLGSWNIQNLESAFDMLSGSGLSCQSYTETIAGWANHPNTPDGIELGAKGMVYFDDTTGARSKLVDEKNWEIEMDISRPHCKMTPRDSGNFITTWKTNLPGMTDSNQIAIPVKGNYNYDVYWESVSDSLVNDTIFNITSNTPISFPDTGTYIVEMSGKFDGINFRNKGDAKKLVSIDHWGDNQWKSFGNAFYGCNYLTLNADDVPDLRDVKNLSNAFRDVIQMENGVEEWDVSKVKKMNGIFRGALKFNADLSNWKVDSVHEMAYAFAETDSFDSDISNWNVGNVTDMEGMFFRAKSFSGDIGNWEVSKVENMSYMFGYAREFLGDISDWEVSNVKDMNYMFFFSNYDGDLGNWNVEKVESMKYMFANTYHFNGDITGWNPASCRDFLGMFEESSAFDQSLGNWNISSAEDMRKVFESAKAMSCENYSNTLIGWASQSNVPENMTIGAEGLIYNSEGEVGRKFLETKKGWNFYQDDLRMVCRIEPGSEENFVTVWNTDPNLNGNQEIRLSINENEVGFDLYFEAVHNSSIRDTLFDVREEDLTIEFPAPGTYRVEINGDFTGWWHWDHPLLDPGKLLSVENWGIVRWSTFTNAFAYCSNMVINASDAPDLRNSYSMGNAFNNASKMDADLSNWDVSNISSMIGLFEDARAFNGDISSWDVSSVTRFKEMFKNAESFNQDISGWNVTRGGAFQEMFFNAHSFNQDLGNWRLKRNFNATRMFSNSGLDCNNYSSTLLGWSKFKGLPQDITIGADGLLFAREIADIRDYLINEKGWAFDGDASTNDCEFCRIQLTALNLRPDDCSTSCDGSAVAISTSGSDPLNYHWSNGEVGRYADELCQGTTSVTVEDEEKCIGVSSIAIPSIWRDVQVETMDASCQSCQDGIATVFPPDLDYQWETGDRSRVLDNLLPGTYELTVTDDERCRKIFRVKIGPQEEEDTKVPGGEIQYVFEEVDFGYDLISKNGENANHPFRTQKLSGKDGTQGLDSSDTFDLQVFPNPATQVLYIDIKGEIVNRISILDSRGQIVDEQEMNKEVDRISIHLNYIPSGLYFVRVNGKIEKFIKQ